jgi:hypothetical protein
VCRCAQKQRKPHSPGMCSRLAPQEVSKYLRQITDLQVRFELSNGYECHGGCGSLAEGRALGCPHALSFPADVAIDTIVELRDREMLRKYANKPGIKDTFSYSQRIQAAMNNATLKWKN